MSRVSSAAPKTPTDQQDLFHGNKDGYDHQVWLHGGGDGLVVPAR